MSILCCRFSLGKSLLMANVMFQKALLQIRSLCENACNSGSGMMSKDDKITLLDTDWYDTMILDTFCERQHKQISEADQKLIKLRKNVVRIVKEACEVSGLHRKEYMKKGIFEKLAFSSKTETKELSRKAQHLIQAYVWVQCTLYRGILNNQYIENGPFRNLEEGIEESAAHSESLGNGIKSAEFFPCGSVHLPANLSYLRFICTSQESYDFF